MRNLENGKKFDFTVVEGFERVIEKLRTIENAQVEIDFILDRIEKQQRKAISSKKTDKIENTEILDLIISELSKAPEGLTISELLKTNTLATYTYEDKKEMKNLSSSKLSAILQKEIYTKDSEGNKIENIDSRIVRIEDKKKIIFKVK